MYITIKPPHVVCMWNTKYKSWETLLSSGRHCGLFSKKVASWITLPIVQVNQLQNEETMGRILIWVELLLCSFTVTAQTLTCLHFQVTEATETAAWPPKMLPFPDVGSDERSCPHLTLKITRRKKKCQCFPSRQQVTVLSAMCAYARVPACPRCRCAKRRELGFGPMKRRCPLQVPPPCRPGTRTLTVIGDCVLLSLHTSLLPPAWLLPLLPCSTFIWPPLAAPGF